jgi:hypothetical protein
MGQMADLCRCHRGSLGRGQCTSADIIYSGPINIFGSAVNIVPEKNHTIGFFDDLNLRRHFVSSTGPNGTHSPAANLLEGFARVGGGALFFDNGVLNNFGEGYFAKNFPAGAPISGPNLRGSTLAFVRSFVTHQGHSLHGNATAAPNYFPNHGFLGMELVQPNGSVEPGWIQVQFTPTFPGLFDVTGWAYSTDGPIDAGQTSATPEPGYLPPLLLAAGATGVLAWKRSRQPAKNPNA